MDTTADAGPRPTRRRRLDTPLDPPLDRPSATVSAEEVSRRAYELFLERGASHGADIDDWLRAERELGGRVES